MFFQVKKVFIKKMNLKTFFPVDMGNRDPQTSRNLVN